MRTQAPFLRLRRVLARVLPRRVGPVLGVERDDLYRGRREHGDVEVVRIHPLVVLDAPVSSHESCPVGVFHLRLQITRLVHTNVLCDTH